MRKLKGLEDIIREQITPSVCVPAYSPLSPSRTPKTQSRNARGPPLAFTVVSPRMGTDGWPFAPADQFPDADADPLYDSRHVKDLYLRAEPAYSGRFTVPVLWDKKRNTIVNNESSEIIRMLNTEFNALVPDDKAQLDLYPAPLRAEIDGVNEWVYDRINSALFFFSFSLPTRWWLTGLSTSSLQMAFTRLVLRRAKRRIGTLSCLSSKILIASRPC